MLLSGSIRSESSLKPLVFDKKFYLGFCIQTKSLAFRQVYRYLRSDESSCTLTDYRVRLMMVHNGNGFVRSQLLDTKTSGVATAAAVPIERKLVKYVIPECDLLDYKFDYEP